MNKNKSDESLSWLYIDQTVTGYGLVTMMGEVIADKHILIAMLIECKRGKCLAVTLTASQSYMNTSRIIIYVR